MPKIYLTQISQHDCPHIHLTAEFPKLKIFIMHTEEIGNTERVFTIFYSCNSQTVTEALTMLKEYHGVKDISIIGKSENSASLLYSFPKTQMYKEIEKMGSRLHPIVARGGTETWFFVSGNNSASFGAPGTRFSKTEILNAKKLSTDEFITSYTRVLFELWKIRTDSILDSDTSDIMEKAVHSGYYEWPRKISVSQLSKVIKIPKSTFTYKLRHAEKNILNDIWKRDDFKF